MLNELLLQSNNDIPFSEAQLTIHNPTLNEISLIGEESFLSGVHFLLISKEQIADKDKVGLEDKSDFNIFMSIMCSSERARYKNDTKMVLTLLFPTLEFSFDLRKGICFKGEHFVTIINDNNFDSFKDIIKQMFDLDEKDSKSDYNPADARAAKIAEKLKKGKERTQKAKGGSTEKVAIFSKYVSILAVGEHKDKNELMNYTVYQIKDEFKRFIMNENFNRYVQMKLAGAKDVDEVQNWMDDIHN